MILLLFFSTQFISINALPRAQRKAFEDIPAYLNSFQTDGCSAYPDGFPHTSENEWLHCCMAHDMKYWIGGSYEEKQKADAELGLCVSEATNDYHGPLMEFGVSIGGSAFLNTGWRWGYGWETLFLYAPLTSLQQEELKQIYDSVLIGMAPWEGHLNQDQMNHLMDRFVLGREKIFRSTPSEEI